MPEGSNISRSVYSSVNIGYIAGNVSGFVSGDTVDPASLDSTSASVANAINQLSEQPGSNQLTLKHLLTQLKHLVETEEELQTEDKIESLEQIGILAELAQKQDDISLKKTAKTSMKILKGTVASLPDDTKLTAECSKLLPEITDQLYRNQHT